MTFRIGQKVVCVNARGVESEGLRLGIYTVTGSTTWLGGQFVGVNGMSVKSDTAPWRASRFRPIVDRPTDISVFTKMLKPTDRKVDA